MLYELAEKTKTQSDEANKVAKQLFENATKIYDTLKRFDQLILEGSQKMLKALDLKPKIEENLNEADTFASKLKIQLAQLNNHLENIKKISFKSTFILQNANSVIILKLFVK